jgi:hypothetical protein
MVSGAMRSPLSGAWRIAVDTPPICVAIPE